MAITFVVMAGAILASAAYTVHKFDRMRRLAREIELQVEASYAEAMMTKDALHHNTVEFQNHNFSQDLIRSLKILSLNISDLWYLWDHCCVIDSSSWLGTQALKTQVVGREQVFSIFGDLPRRDAPTANLDLTLGATCTRKALDPCSSQFFSNFSVYFALKVFHVFPPNFSPFVPCIWCTSCLFVCIDVGNKLTADATWSFWRLHSTKEIQLLACQALPPKVWDAEQQPCAEEILQIFDNFLTFSAKERRLRALGGARATRSPPC